MKAIGPEHPITTAPLGQHVVVRFHGTVIAESDAALALQEASYPRVIYVPRGDVHMAHLSRTAKTSHCPYKGDASYFSIAAGGEEAADAAWSYETPFAQMAVIAGHLAFYPNKVELELG